MPSLLLRLAGWPLTVLREYPTVFDRWVWLRRYLWPGPRRTLDAGCGTGAFTLYAAKIGNEAIGITWDEQEIQHARARAQMLGVGHTQFVQADLRELDRLAPQLGRFDQVICLEVIEHIHDDRRLLAGLSALLPPGGRLLLTTPYKHYRPLRSDHLSVQEDGGHVRWGYTHEEMRALMAGCGLEVVVAEYVSGFVSQNITNLMRRLTGRNFGLVWALTFPLRFWQLFDRPLTRLLRYPYFSIAVVAIKRDGDT
jgi:2-polyprenyl-3-methyl-5-hydroxy-6-metoxy-1,4-benzoquinol methylase